MPTDTTAGPLTDAQIRSFHELGYLVVEDIFTPADLQPVIDDIGREVDMRARRLVKERLLTHPYEGEDFDHRLAKIARETDKIAYEIGVGQLSGPPIFNLIRHQRLGDVAEQICGEELIASAVYRLRPKLPSHKFGEVPWHQDAGYTDPYCDKGLMLTVWIPLVDANEENGCLWVIPGVHRDGILRHARRSNKTYLVIPSDALPKKNQPIPVPVKKGGALLMTNFTPHASFENRTDRVRWSMDLRYQNAKLPTNAKITRLAGEEVSSDDNQVPPACYPPEADFLVRSKRRPEQIITRAEEFHRLRKEHLAQPYRNRWTEVVEE